MILAKERRARSHTPGWAISGGSAASDGELRQQMRAACRKLACLPSMACLDPAEEQAGHASCAAAR
jgi:hypothetical protein